MNLGLLLGLAGLTMWGILRLAEHAFMTNRKKGLVEVIYIDGDDGTWSRHLIKPSGGEYQRTNPDGTMSRFILPARGRFSGPTGPLFLQNPRTGLCYWPDDRSTIEHGNTRSLKLSVTSPEVYHLAAARKNAAAATAADVDDKKQWWENPMIMYVGMGIGIVLVLLIGVIAWKLAT